MRTSFNAYLIIRVVGSSLKVLKALMDLRAKVSTDYESGEIRAHLKVKPESLSELIKAVNELNELTRYCIVKPYLTIKLGSDEFRKTIKSLRKFCSNSVVTPTGVFRCVKVFNSHTVFLEGRPASGVIKAIFVREVLTHPYEVPSKIQVFTSCSDLGEEQVIKGMNHLLSYLSECLG